MLHLLHAELTHQLSLQVPTVALPLVLPNKPPYNASLIRSCQQCFTIFITATKIKHSALQPKSLNARKCVALVSSQLSALPIYVCRRDFAQKSYNLSNYTKSACHTRSPLLLELRRVVLITSM